MASWQLVASTCAVRRRAGTQEITLALMLLVIKLKANPTRKQIDRLQQARLI